MLIIDCVMMMTSDESFASEVMRSFPKVTKAQNGTKIILLGV
jgi:hypothetical protein